ncbi:Uncaracterized surface protein containing fasciclin (FAS1) repeats [Salinimicrobium sediminis]|uniref:Uncaracterized surface protein containing fasciclin (FAS1) repeats n=1 Tax=Salinimicrobium sediminis TaxID=1343891 RepID=A0A285X7X5_9FLAO|nr:fasciclin domain-containing protein [Salinimicrobium sediminis]SOC80884.1 Uncaracterized surface protein containing fasciclin (FAS1) repeats [Salinimicrobium sediminis]
MNLKLNKFLIISFLTLVAFTSCKDNERETETIETVETTDEDFENRRMAAGNMDGIIEAVETNAELSTFATALNAWNVEDSVEKMEGEVIIFAPTNMAFSTVRQNIEAGTMIAIEDEEMISYHIIRSEDDLAAIKEEIRSMNDTLKLATVQGEDLMISLDGNSLVLTGATGESARITDSIQAGNGMVYIIDKVLLPRDPNKEVIISNEG